MSNLSFIQKFFEEERKGFQRHENLSSDETRLYSYGSHFPLAIKCVNGYALNGDSYSITTSKHQGVVRSVVHFKEITCCILSFNVIERSLRFKTENIEIIDVQEDSGREVEYKDKDGKDAVRYEHLLGGSIFKYEGRYFLSSVDAGARFGRGYFITELIYPVKTFGDGLEQMKPDEVRYANANHVEGIKRQGEWFFIPVAKDTNEFKRATGLLFPLKSYVVKWGNLPVVVGDDRVPHHRVRDMVEMGNKIYVRGMVKHSGGEHKQVFLGEVWHEAVHNVQVNSWSYRGRVD